MDISMGFVRDRTGHKHLWTSEHHTMLQCIYSNLEEGKIHKLIIIVAHEVQMDCFDSRTNVKSMCSHLPLHNQSYGEGDFGVFLVECGFLQFHAGVGGRRVTWNIGCWRLGYVWAGSGGTPRNLVAGSRGRAAGRASWKQARAQVGKGSLLTD